MWQLPDRETLQSAARAAALVFVVAWLFSDDLRAWIPFWLPLVLLLAAEIEFVVRGRRNTRTDGGDVAPGPEDADLGFGELVEDADGLRFVPPPARTARRGRRAGWIVGAAAAAVWSRSPLAATGRRRGRRSRRMPRPGPKHASPRRLPPSQAVRYAFAATTGMRSPAPEATPSVSRFSGHASPTSTRPSAARSTTSPSAGTGGGASKRPRRWSCSPTRQSTWAVSGARG